MLMYPRQTLLGHTRGTREGDVGAKSRRVHEVSLMCDPRNSAQTQRVRALLTGANEWHKSPRAHEPSANFARPHPWTCVSDVGAKTRKQ